LQLGYVTGDIYFAFQFATMIPKTEVTSVTGRMVLSDAKPLLWMGDLRLGSVEIENAHHETNRPITPESKMGKSPMRGT